MRLLEHFFGLIAPSSCLLCGHEGSHLCEWCRDEALPEHAGRCYKCNQLTRYGAVCPADRRKSPLKRVFIRAEYEGAAKDLVHMMKFSYSGEAADLIAEELVHTLPVLTPDTVVVHVPTITNHVRVRGFDHAARMAREVSRRTGLRHSPALGRIGQHRQVGSKRQQRLTSMDTAFRMKQNYMVRGAPVLLVDDVLTTGATLEAAARVLIAAGASRVDAAVFARAK